MLFSTCLELTESTKSTNSVTYEQCVEMAPDYCVENTVESFGSFCICLDGLRQVRSFVPVHTTKEEGEINALGR
jgi:hypothetical protein